MFEREAETLQSLSHPAIPHYLDHFHVQTTKTKGLALVQSYIQAKSLEECVKLGRQFNEAEIKHIAKALLEILMYLHAQHPPVIHRDIKPSNILLGNRSGNSFGQVYLVDFGSVQTLAATEGSTITVVGTYGYMPPEQFGGRAVTASDLYSLGATLIYLVTGMHPADLPQEDGRIQFQPKIHLDSALVDWLQWMTEPDLNSRLTSAKKALKVLNEPGKSENKSPVFRKPVGSKVKLTKDRNSLEIIVPKSGNSIIYILIIIFGLSVTFPLWLFLLVVGIANIVEAFTHLSFPGSLINGFIGILLVCIFCSPILMIIKLFPKSTQLQINQHIISLNKRRSSPRKAILKLGFLRHYDTNSRVRRNIEIWAGTQVYKLPTKTLSDREVDWIAFELSNFLNLPIDK
ncbi:serine/threonine protein kinase [Coleofasciculus sp.]|uniref:serine/threonine protein kinase n=1 Tax=Coleofasciculus sp. TaxID=3100458 RepID=UPI003A2F2058